MLGHAADVLKELAKPGVAVLFTDRQMNADHMAHLQADRKAIGDLQAVQDIDELENVEATAALEERLFKEGGGHFAEVDTAVRNKYARNPEKLAA